MLLKIFFFFCFFPRNDLSWTFLYPFLYPYPQFLLWGTSRSAKLDNQSLRNLIFIPFTKVASAHPSMNYFQIVWCDMIDETLSHPYM